MNIREEQCNKVCRILDDVLANRTTERDSLIVAVRKAFESLEQFGNSEPLPSAQPEQRWIPVSERLPEIKQHVLLSCYGRVIYGRMISEDGNSGYPVFEICDSVGEKRPIVLETTVHSEFTTSRIIAWMPLPTPYREE